MRRSLAGLTVRGRAFLAAGLTTVGCAILLGQSTLVRIGALAFFLPLVAAFFVSLRRYQLRVTRTLRPAVAQAGETTQVELVISNHGGNGGGALLVEDQVPYALGSRPRFVLRGLRRTWERDVTYPVRSDVRGQFRIGPLTITSSDPFGMLELHTVLPGSSTLTVTPRVIPLPRAPLSGGWGGSGDHRPQSFASGSAEDVTVREYRRGDDLRRVHWRSSAKVGELMVRKEEQPWEARATVVLDNRTHSHRGTGLGSSFEAAVMAAASVAVHLDAQGYVVQFATADTFRASAEGSVGLVLEQLATVTTVGLPKLDTSWSGDTGTGGIVVAVLGGIGDADLGTLRRLRYQHTAAVALALDIDQWVGAGDDDRAVAAPLTSAGWRAVPLGVNDRLDHAWRDLAGSPLRAARQAY